MKTEEYQRRMTIAHTVLQIDTEYRFCQWDGKIYQNDYEILDMNELINHPMIPVDLKDGYDIKTEMCGDCKKEYLELTELTDILIKERFWEGHKDI